MVTDRDRQRYRGPTAIFRCQRKIADCLPSAVLSRVHDVHGPETSATPFNPRGELHCYGLPMGSNRGETNTLLCVSVRSDLNRVHYGVRPSHSVPKYLRKDLHLDLLRVNDDQRRCCGMERTPTDLQLTVAVGFAPMRGDGGENSNRY